ncbi:MAG: Gfo/Idh/MocA family oxidoreductase [Gemmatimonadaceae bacterium]|nr:Gfo/Idh/MocA family oxidoreductase [Gemmatimonadaceae bacterium]
MKPALRIGVIGVGAIAQVAQLPTLARLRGAQLVALCDNDGPKARALAERFGVPDVFTDIDEMLEFDELDAVVISTPSHLHEPHVLSALAAGIHVLCERPLALTVRGIERILAAAARSDRKVAVANNHRFRSDVQAVAAFLRGGELGKLSGVRTGSYQSKRAAEGWRLRRAESGGGVFMEQGVAMLDLALWLADFPEPVRVSAHMERGRGASTVEDAMLAFVECEQGKTIVIDVDWAVTSQEDRWWFDVLATRGSAQLAPFRVVKALNATPFDVTPRGAAVRESAVTQSYRAELAHFLAVLRDEASYEPPSDQVVVHRIAEAIYKSADEEKEIRL